MLTAPDDPTTWTATSIGRSVAAGHISAAEVLEAHLARVERLNPALRAVTSRRDDDARRDASAIDAVIGRGGAVTPLAGVPITVKETTDVAGLATTPGCGPSPTAWHETTPRLSTSYAAPGPSSSVTRTCRP